VVESHSDSSSNSISDFDSNSNLNLNSNLNSNSNSDSPSDRIPTLTTKNSADNDIVNEMSRSSDKGLESWAIGLIAAIACILLLLVLAGVFALAKKRERAQAHDPFTVEDGSIARPANLSIYGSPTMEVPSSRTGVYGAAPTFDIDGSPASAPPMRSQTTINYDSVPEFK
jgi:hypothetical protein